MTTQSKRWVVGFTERDTYGKATANDYAKMDLHIAASCEQIRASWNEGDYRRHRDFEDSPVIPVIRVRDIVV